MQALLLMVTIGEAQSQVAWPHTAATQQRESHIADLAFIAKLGQDSY